MSVCYEKSSLFAKKICTFWTFWISNLSARRSKPDGENTPTCNCQNYILAQPTRLLIGQPGPSNDDGDNENGDVADDVVSCPTRRDLVGGGDPLLGVGDVCFFLTMRCFNDAMFSNS